MNYSEYSFRRHDENSKYGMKIYSRVVAIPNMASRGYSGISVLNFIRPLPVVDHVTLKAASGQIYNMAANVNIDHQPIESEDSY